MTLISALPDTAYRAQTNRFAILAKDPKHETPVSILPHSVVSNLARYKGESDDILS